jgi:hypothetical protein
MVLYFKSSLFDKLFSLFYANGYKEIPVNVANYLLKKIVLNIYTFHGRM